MKNKSTQPPENNNPKLPIDKDGLIRIKAMRMAIANKAQEYRVEIKESMSN
jgi:hypothetical protein